MCGSFTCSKNSLIALNILYILVAVVLIAVAGAAKFTAVVTSLSVVSGIIACGVFLLMISIVGLAAASKHHQVLLFFYMIVLFIIFVIQFAVACACLAMNEDQQEVVLTQGWKLASEKLREEAQVMYGCCGYDSLDDPSNSTLGHPSCLNVVNSDGEQCCDGNVTQDTCCQDAASCKCSLCKPLLMQATGNGFSAVGGVGLFFSFTEFLGVWLTVRFRNQRDPRSNPSAFL